MIRQLSRRSFFGAAAAGTYLVGCTRGDYWDTDEASARSRDTKIVRAAIHPGIGVARVGNSSHEHFIGPEVVEPPLTPAGASRDASGALKRQAARFRIYGYNAAGEIVREITAEDAEVEWEVHLANKKAQWYRFLHALDIPEARSTRSVRRNADVKGAARAALVLDPGARRIAGARTEGAAYRFDGASFQGVPVSLGELRTDDGGRLLVLGGLGQAGSPGNRPIYDASPGQGDSFNNADGWYDDIADGPVSASVRIDGREIPVESAWVFVAPPNYAPDVIGWRTLYDLLVDTYVEAGMLTPPRMTSFTQDVLPALRRLSNLQWVNKGFALGFGRGTDFDFDDPEIIARLASGKDDPAVTALRGKIHGSFRPPQGVADKRKWPWMYGDAFGSFESSARNELGPSPLRALHLQRWAAGDYEDDWSPDAKVHRQLADVPLGQQPAMLDRAALHYCLADAFHPGCELTWPMRHASLYSAPFRIKRRAQGQIERDLGDELTQAKALAPNGPLHAQGPGDLTRWMALPWQGDTVFCRSGYDHRFDPHLPTFWPARVPNHVLTEVDYRTAMDTSLPREQRVAAFRKRAFWTRALDTDNAVEQMNRMVREFGRMGVVEARPGVENDPDLPPTMLVESLPPAIRGVPTGPLGSESGPPLAQGSLGEAGWSSQEQLDSFLKIINGHGH